MPIRFQRLRLCVRAGGGGEDELNHPRKWRRSADRVDQQAAADWTAIAVSSAVSPMAQACVDSPAGGCAGQDPVTAGDLVGSSVRWINSRVSLRIGTTAHRSRSAHRLS